MIVLSFAFWVFVMVCLLADFVLSGVVECWFVLCYALFTVLDFVAGSLILFVVLGCICFWVVG